LVVYTICINDSTVKQISNLSLCCQSSLRTPSAI